MDTLEFLDTEAEPVEAPLAEPVEAPAADLPRDEQGKFVKAEPKPEPVMVPLAALHETRDKVRDLEAKLEAQQPQAQPQKAPDVFEDPEGFSNNIDQKLDAALYGQRLDMSHRFAVQQHGEDVVKQALDWGKQRCAEDPHFNAQVRANPDPVAFAIDQHRRETVASQVDLGEYEQFKAWKAAQAEATPQPTPAAVPVAPRSLASIPSSGGAAHVPTGPGQAFDTLFT